MTLDGRSSFGYLFHAISRECCLGDNGYERKKSMGGCMPGTTYWDGVLRAGGIRLETYAMRIGTGSGEGSPEQRQVV